MFDRISRHEWQKLPAEAQQEVLDFFLLVKAKYEQQEKGSEPALLSEHALAEGWLNKEEDEAWAKFQ